MTHTPQSPHNDDVGLVLAGDFVSPSMEDWLDAVAKVLNRNRPEDKQFTGEQAVAKLQVRTVDGIEIDPIYTLADQATALGVPGSPPFTRGTTVRNGDMGAWDIRALYEDPDVARTRRSIKEDLERGVTSLWFRIDPDAIAASDLQACLADVFLNLAKVDVCSRTDQELAAQAMVDLIDNAGAEHHDITLGLGLDPIGLAALHGTTPDQSTLAGWVRYLTDFKKARAITVDATIWHNAGAGDVHEVAWAIATATEYARTLIAAGIEPDVAFDAINFRVTASCDEFATIARLRALRTCWNRVGEVLGVSPEHRGARQHAVTSWREITRDDPYVNILRGTISAFSAAVGGAEATTVLPFDTAWGLPQSFSRRIARNTQILLAEESNIGRVNDPGGGSWYLEHLTADMEQKAWAEFQRVEAAGGMAHVVATRGLDDTLQTLNDERARRLAKRSKPITGVSEFPKIDETALDTVARPQAPTRAGIAWHRDAEVFEQLRDRTAAAETNPRVFLACLGARRDFGPREGFASNMFHVAGLPTPQSEGGSPDDIVAAWQADGSTPVVCLCSSGKVYAEQALPVAKALKDAGVAKVYLAGALKELGEQADEATQVIDGTVAMGMDVVATCTEILNTLGVK